MQNSFLQSTYMYPTVVSTDTAETQSKAKKKRKKKTEQKKWRKGGEKHFFIFVLSMNYHFSKPVWSSHNSIVEQEYAQKNAQQAAVMEVIPFAQ